MGVLAVVERVQVLRLALVLVLLAPWVAATDAQGYTAVTVWSDDFSAPSPDYAGTYTDGQEPIRWEDGHLHMPPRPAVTSTNQVTRDLPEDGPSRVGLYARVMVSEDIGKIHLLEGFGASLFGYDGQLWYRAGSIAPLGALAPDRWHDIGFCIERVANTVNVTFDGSFVGTFAPHADNSLDLLLGDREDTSMGMGEVWWDDLRFDSPCEDAAGAPLPVADPAQPLRTNATFELTLAEPVPAFYSPGGRARLTFALANQGPTEIVPAFGMTSNVEARLLPYPQRLGAGESMRIEVDLVVPPDFTGDVEVDLDAQWEGWSSSASARLPPADADSPLIVRLTLAPTYAVPGTTANVTFDVVNTAATDLDVSLSFEVEGAVANLRAGGNVVPANGTLPVHVELALDAALDHDLDGTLTVVSGAARAQGTVHIARAPVPVVAPNVTEVAHASPEPSDVVASGPRDAAQAAVVSPEDASDHPTSLGGIMVDAAAAHPVATTVTATGTAVGVAALLASRSDAARFALAAGPLMGMFTRIHRREALEHNVRQDLHQAILSEPGVSYSDLKRRFGLATGVAVHHLRSLEQHRLVVSRREGMYRRFYPVAVALTPVETDPLTPMQKRILAHLEKGPRSQGELAAALGVTRQGANFHVKTLERGGWVRYELGPEGWRVLRTGKPRP